MTLTAPLPAYAHWIPLMPVDSLTAQDAGALIRKRRLERGMTQDQLVERTGLSSQSYLSALEKGRYHIGKSEHFPAVARELRLSEDDIRLINPSAVFSVPDSAPFDPRTLFHPPAQQQRRKRPLWPNLSAMIEEKQGKYPELAETRWQQHLNGTRFSGGQEPDVDGWFEMFRAMERAGVDPEPWPDE